MKVELKIELLVFDVIHVCEVSSLTRRLMELSIKAIKIEI